MRFSSSLMPRIIDHAAAFHEAGAEYGIPSLVEHLPVADDVAAIVGFVGHHHHHGVARHVIEAARNGAAEAVLARDSGPGCSAGTRVAQFAAAFPTCDRCCRRRRRRFRAELRAAAIRRGDVRRWRRCIPLRCAPELRCESSRNGSLEPDASWFMRRAAFQPIGIISDVYRNFVENRGQSRLGRPTELPGRARRIHDQPGNVDSGEAADLIPARASEAVVTPSR